MFGEKELIKGPSSLFTPGKRRRMNLVGICMNVFLPWFMFGAIFALLSFSYRYQFPYRAFAMVCCIYCIVLITAYLAFSKKRRDRDPMWYIFAFIMFLIAAIAGTVCGDLNFYFYMQPFYDLENLNIYPNVNPAQHKGQALMDAGQVSFADGAVLDRTKSMGFKDTDLYCVAPIVKGSETLPQYDFWAVGVNCCSGVSSDFRCGQYNNPHARSGLRLMRDDLRDKFRLAVQEAEAVYKIQSNHPLFFYWMQDPWMRLNEYRDEGFKHYLVGIFSFFAWNLFCVIAAVVGFSKIGRY